MGPLRNRCVTDGAEVTERPQVDLDHTIVVYLFVTV
jgi:hypothetical protein